MPKNRSSQPSDVNQSIKKILLSAFVIGSFGIYVASEHLAKPVTTATINQSVSNTSANTTLAGQIKDGTYIGSEEDAYYGLVKVQTTISSGKITDVQFLEFPKDRRTSQRINSFAVPNLQQEAIQAQTANVDIISGATLTSEAFKASLQTALNAARN